MAQSRSSSLAGLPIIVLCAVAAGGATAAGYWLALEVVGKPPKNVGHFGDSFGVVGTLFAAFSSLLVAWTLHLQYREIRGRASEIDLTVKELRTSAEAQQKVAQLMSVSTHASACTGRVNHLATRLDATEAERVAYRRTELDRRNLSMDSTQPVDAWEEQLRDRKQLLEKQLRSANAELKDLLNEARRLNPLPDVPTGHQNAERTQ